MLAAVKMPHIKFVVNGTIPTWLIKKLQLKYGEKVEISEDDYIEAKESDWYQKISRITRPGDILKTLRQNAGLTQGELGKKFGKVSARYISDMENSRRPISKKMAMRFAQIFQISESRLLGLSG